MTQVCNNLGACGKRELGHMCVEHEDCDSGSCKIGSEFAPGICIELASEHTTSASMRRVQFLDKVWLWLWSYE